MIRKILAALALASPLAALAAASGSAITPVGVSVEGGETRVFQARFLAPTGAPAANETITWANDVCGTFPNGSSQATSVTDSNGVATIPFTAAPNAGITCWLTAVAGPASVNFDVVTYKLSQVSIAVEVGTFFDPNGSADIRTSVRLGQHKLREVEIYGRVLAGTAPAPLRFSPTTGSTGQAGTAFFSLTPPAPNVGPYEVEFTFKSLTKKVTVNRPAAPAPVKSITGASPPGGQQTLAITNGSEGCGFNSSSLFLNPAVTTFTPDNLPARGLVYTEGIMTVRTENCAFDRPVTFTLTTPRPLPTGSQLWIKSATKERTDRHWHAIPVTINGNNASFTITDGLNDADLVSDGSITFFGGFAVAPSWYYALQDLWWGGIGENGWGVSIVQHDEQIFAVVFAYDGNGMPTWYVMPGGSWNASRTAFTGALYSPRGAPYTAYDASRLDVGPAIGTITLSFIDGNNANLAYTINGMTGTKQIMRQPFGPPSTNTRPVVGDMWWGGGAQNGWGIAILQQYGTLFAVWFTYSSTGEPTWFVMPSGAWTATDTFEGRIYRTSSSRWLAMAYNSSAFRVTDVGSFKVRFTSSESATFDWTIEGRSGSMPLTRQPF